MRFILLVLCGGLIWITLSLESSSQSFFEPGYLVTTVGDTVHVEIDNQEWVQNPVRITFRRDDGSIGDATSGDIIAFGVSGDHFVVREVWIDGTPRVASGSGAVSPSGRTDVVFLRRLVEGPLSLYFYRDNRDHFFVEDAQFIRELVSHQYTQQEVSGPFQRVRNDRFIVQIDQYRQTSCPEVQTGRLTYGEASFTGFVRRCNAAIEGVPFVAGPRQPMTFRHYVHAGGSRLTTRYGMGNDAISMTGDISPAFGYYVSVDRRRGRGRTSVLGGLEYQAFAAQSVPGFGSLQPVFESEHKRVQGAILVRRRHSLASIRPITDLGFTITKHFGQTDALLEPGSQLYPGARVAAGLEAGPVVLTASHERVLALSSGFGVSVAMGF